ncbi:B12-binding domain-containing radical SAM protein, partial [Chloroflexota bacterium]
AELDTLYNQGWRAGVFIVDDNFIGNKTKLKEEILPAIIKWQQDRKHPFGLSTEASINLADDEELMRLMGTAGFDTVFIGIETPNEEGLAECNKHQNRDRDLVDSVKKIQNHGLRVEGGFILGFDSDPISIFKSQIDFIQKSGIVTAMVGLLNAPPGSRLYQRLKKENRILETVSGNNTDCSMNFIPKMDHQTLINGYKHILTTIYSPKQYYMRVKILLKEYKPRRRMRVSHLQFCHISSFIRSMWFLGVRDEGRGQYWRFFVSTLLRHPRSFPLSMVLAVYGLHFRTVVRDYTRVLVEDAPT